MRSAIFMVAGAVLGACTTASPASLSAGLEAQTTSALWSQHQASGSRLELMYIEAELGARGQTTRRLSFLGQRARLTYGQPLYVRNGGGRDVANCSDFPSSAAAQKYFLAAGGPFQDPNDLDRDGDGLACEWGVRLTQIAAAYTAPVVVARPRYTAHCYVGPRGGTYTLTASGNRNYAGC